MKHGNGLGRVGVGRLGFARNHEPKKGGLTKLGKDHDTRLQWADLILQGITKGSQGKGYVCVLAVRVTEVTAAVCMREEKVGVQKACRGATLVMGACGE